MALRLAFAARAAMWYSSRPVLAGVGARLSLTRRAASTVVPPHAGAEGGVCGPALAWALQESHLAAAIDAVRVAEFEETGTAAALAAKLTAVFCEGRDMTPEASAKRLLALRSGAIAGATRLEREYAALFASVRTARADILKAVTDTSDTVSGAVMRPTSAELRAGRSLPVAHVAALLAMDATSVVSGSDAVVAALQASDEAHERLRFLYDALDKSPAEADERLQALALRGTHDLPRRATATAAERAYCAQLARVREWRAAVARSLATTDAAAVPAFRGVQQKRLRAGMPLLALVGLPDGRLASGGADGVVSVWDTSSEISVAKLQGHADEVTSLAVLQDGRLASGSVDGSVKLWDVASGECVATLGGDDDLNAVTSLAYLPDGRLATGNSNHTVKVWDVTTRTCVATLSGHADSVWAVAHLQDGRLATGSQDETIKLWDAATGSCVATLSGHTGEVWSLVCLPDGRLASGSLDGTIKLWDVASGACIETLHGHDHGIGSLVCMPDGRLASGGYDNTVRVWDLELGTCVTTLSDHDNDVMSIIKLPRGGLASCSRDCSIVLWK